MSLLRQRTKNGQGGTCVEYKLTSLIVNELLIYL